MSVAGLVLAAGAGVRYGEPKVFAEDGAWLRRACQALSDSGCAPVHVVLGAGLPGTLPPGAVAVHAADWAEGMGASLRAGFASLADHAVDAVAILLVDTPDITAEVVGRVSAGAGAQSLARAVYHGEPGHPVLVGRDHWPALLASLTGDGGAHRFLRHNAELRRVECADLATGADRDYR